MVSATATDRARTVTDAEVEYLKHGDTLLAIIVPGSFYQAGIRFFTPNDFSQQLAYMRHPVAKTIPPHVHNPVPREVHHTLEVLFIKRGKVRVDFYDEREQYLESRILCSGDVILLASGGHGFEMLEETEMIEVKQGPYAGENDKRRFDGISAAGVRFHRGE
jgi:mannose-6-phosphate isomerase-like protein (cupin superfamily)